MSDQLIKYETAVITEGQKLVQGFYIPDHQKDFYYSLVELFKSNKGILLMGEIGAGKSLCMKVCKAIFKYGKMITTREICREYGINGDTILDTYGRKSVYYDDAGELKPINYCFDDLGVNDSNRSRYGNKVNPMEEIILDRYDKFIEIGMKTFFTTNESTDTLRAMYGERVYDRLKEMCNPIIMSGKSLRK